MVLGHDIITQPRDLSTKDPTFPSWHYSVTPSGPVLDDCIQDGKPLYALYLVMSRYQT